MFERASRQMIKFFICHTKERLLLLVIWAYLLSLKDKVKEIND